MTHDELIKRQLHQLRYKNPLKLHFVEQANASNQEIPDIITIEVGRPSTLYEMKASRPDFLGDKKKVFREFPEQGMGNFRYYVCPKGLIDISEIPDRWGLAWVYPSQIRMQKEAEFQPCDKDSERRLVISALYKEHRKNEDQAYRISGMQYELGRYKNEINYLTKERDRLRELATIHYECISGCGYKLTRIIDEPERECLGCRYGANIKRKGE